MDVNQQQYQQNVFPCFCNQQLVVENIQSIKEHIKNCQIYQQKSPISQIFQQINFNQFDIPQCLALKSEFQIYLETIDNFLDIKGYFNRPIPLIKNNSKNDHLPIDFSQFAKSTIKCPSCEKEYYDFDLEKFHYLSNCDHFFCKACIGKAITQDYIKAYGQIKCLDNKCDKCLTQSDMIFVITKEKFDKLDEQLTFKQLNLINCVKCQQQIDFVSGSVQKNQKNLQGQVIKEHQAKHYAENRFVCPKPDCKTEQCKDCKANPYHLGFTCEEFVVNQNMQKCRYCDEPIANVNQKLPKAQQDICKKPDCQERFKNSCQKEHQCGHICGGIKGELECLPCLQEDCAAKNSEELLQQKHDDYCNICFIEGLENAPCVRPKCGHIFHFHCIEKRLKIKWFRPRITFNFCLCPLCKKWMEFNADVPFYKLMAENLQMLEIIKKMCAERLKHEGREKDEKLVNKQSDYYQKPVEYGLAIYSYYQCFKCKKPYFGGLKSCENVAQEDQPGQEGKEGYDPANLVCASCCPILNVEDCKKHGRDFIEFKCKFCCAIAVWFCFGTTHFCEPCHRDRQDLKPANTIKVCQGMGKCALNLQHLPNGQECALGCSLCRNEVANQKNY